MSVRKTPAVSTAAPNAPPPRTRKKTRAPRVRLTHFEIRRGEALRLRIALADDALAEVGDELGSLIRRIAPSTQTTVVESVPGPNLHATRGEYLHTTRGEDFVVSRQHAEHDAAYHAELREHLVDLFSSFCDTALEAALDVARKERDRRAEGGN